MKLFLNKKHIVLTALVTPFKDNLNIDYVSLKKLVDHQLQYSIDGLVVLGTTGESPTILKDEREFIINAVKNNSKGRCPVIVGTGTNSTYQTIEWTNQAQSLGADAALIVTPYYNNPSNEEIYEHYKMIATKTQFPFILYHVPKRTGSCLNQTTINKILNLEYCVGFKDATSNAEMIKTYPSHLYYFDGDDLNASYYCKHGGNGVISVVSNAYPKQMKDYLECHSEKLESTINSLSCHVNPVPIKALLKMINLIESDITRPPLKQLNEHQKKSLKHII